MQAKFKFEPQEFLKFLANKILPKRQAYVKENLANFITCVDREYAIALSLLIAPSCLSRSFALTSSTVPGMSHHPC